MKSWLRNDVFHSSHHNPMRICFVQKFAMDMDERDTKRSTHSCYMDEHTRYKVKNCYLSNRPQVSMVYRLINHAGCCLNTRRICKSRAAGE